MVIQTKKYKMPLGLYVKLGLLNVLRMQWWVPAIVLLFMCGTLFVRTKWFLILGTIFFMFYMLFWIIQFYGIAQLEENRIMFDRLSYAISNDELLVKVSGKHGMPIPWSNIIWAQRKKSKYFLLSLSKVQFFCLPYKIFQSDNDIQIFSVILQRKKLLK